jgi:SagB-type dehydrogenase family enzyme
MGSNKKRLPVLFLVFFILTVISFAGICLLSSCRIIEQAGSYIRYNMGIGTAEDNEGEGILDLMGEEIMLPEPDLESDFSLEKAMANRRSVRNFSQKELELEKISQLLWAAQGITKKDTGYRTTPSAGALYPLELFLVKSDGVFHYEPEENKLEKMLSEDLKVELAEASVYQGFIAIAPISIVITAVYERITVKYGERGIRYIYMEAGHSCQNLLLQAVALGLGAVPIGAFDDDQIQNLLNLPSDYRVLYVIPVGYPQ